MHKNTILFNILKSIVLLFVSLPINAQTANLDSLEKLSDINSQVEYYNQLSRYYYFKSNTDSIEWAARKSYSLAQSSKSDSLMSIGNRAVGTAFWSRGEADSAAYYYQLSYESALTANYNEYIIRSLSNVAMVALNQKNYKKSLEVYNTILEELPKREYPPNTLVSVYNGLGNVYKRMGEYKNANKYLFKALKVCEENALDNLTGNVLSNIGTVYQMSEAYPEAIEKQKEAIHFAQKIENARALGNAQNNLGLTYLNIDSLDQAQKYFTDALATKKQTNNASSLNSTLGNLGVVCFKNKQYTKAIKYSQEALAIQIENGDKTQELESYQLLAEIYLAKGETRKAGEFTDKAISLAKSMNANSEITDSYFIKSKVLASKGLHKSAYNYFLSYDSLKQVMLSEEHKKAVMEIEAKYDTEKLEKENLLQKLEIERSENKLTIQRFLLFATLVAIALFAFTVWFIQNKRQEEQKNSLMKTERLQRIEEENKNLLSIEKQLKTSLDNTQEKLTLLTETQEKTIKLNGKYIVKIKEVKFIRIENKLLVFYLTEGRTVKLPDTLADWERYLPSSLMPRIHKSCLVNLLHVQKQNYDSVLLLDGEKLPIGRSYISNVKQVWQAWSSRNTAV